MPGHQRLKAPILILLIASGAWCQSADLDEIVRRGTAEINSDWAQDPNYAYVERDETVKGGKTTSKTSQVVMMDGSDYYMPIAFNDEPLPMEQRKAELRKLKGEFHRREMEDPESRQRRIEKWKKQENENGSLLLEVPKAFDFELLREETMNGFPAYALSGTPIKRTGPLSRAAKVLSGMEGTVWIDRENFHTIRGDCRVTSPVPIYGILARVLPGTRVELDLSPVSESVWLITQFSMTLNLSKFLLFNSRQVTHNTYSNYRLNSVVLQELMEAGDAAPAGVP